MERMLKLLEEDATLTPRELALMLSKEEGDISKMITELEEKGVILGRRTVIDWEKVDREHVSALIEVKVLPQRDDGFDKIAERIAENPEIKSLHLMSGGFDFAVIDAVTATATHFVLKTYKDKGVVYGAPKSDMRESVVL